MATTSDELPSDAINISPERRKTRRTSWFKIVTIIGCGFSIFSALLGIGYISLAGSKEYAALSGTGLALGTLMLALGIFGFAAYWRFWKRKGLSHVLAINIFMAAFFFLLIALNEFNVWAPINFMALLGAAVVLYLLPRNAPKRPREETASRAP